MFPHDVLATTEHVQGKKLQELAKDKTCLEIGAFCGFTTICMALVAKVVYSIDCHEGDVHLGDTRTFATFYTNLKRYRVLDRVAIFNAYSQDVLPYFPQKFFDLSFIDGTHTYEAVRSDLDNVLPLMKDGSLVTFHDYDEPQDHTVGVKMAVDETIDKGLLKPIDQVGTLLVCQFQS